MYSIFGVESILDWDGEPNHSKFFEKLHGPTRHLRTRRAWCPSVRAGVRPSALVKADGMRLTRRRLGWVAKGTIEVSGNVKTSSQLRAGRVLHIYESRAWSRHLRGYKSRERQTSITRRTTCMNTSYLRTFVSHSSCDYNCHYLNVSKPVVNHRAQRQHARRRRRGTHTRPGQYSVNKRDVDKLLAAAARAADI